MAYIDGFVIAVPTADKEKFRQHALDVDTLFTKHGAVQVIEAWGEDVPKGETTDFFKAVKAKNNETVVFSWIIWPDKAARDAGNAKVFAEMQEMDKSKMEMPFDGKRMIFGGFEALVELNG